MNIEKISDLSNSSLEKDRELSIKLCSIESAVTFSKSKYLNLLKQFNGSGDAAFEGLLNSKHLQNEFGLTSALVQACYDRMRSAFDSLGEDVTVVNTSSKAYPVPLALTDSPPPVLFIKGNVGALNNPGVSVVGSRTASDEGLRRAATAARLLKQLNYNVVSGLARGIDTAAHIGALHAAGHTVAVIGTPINKYYPSENQILQDQIAHKGTLVSQFSPVHPTLRYNFPLRNSTMSGLTFATVIVEASETSGALTQAKFCLSQKRKLFIMQNQIDRKDLKWPSEFLKKGGIPLKSIEDLKAELEGMRLVPEKQKQPTLF